MNHRDHTHSEMQDLLEAANSAQSKLDAAMIFLKDKQIHNLMLREGYPMEAEKIVDGEVVISECYPLQKGQSLSNEIEASEMYFSRLPDGRMVDGMINRADLKAIANRISPDWEKEIRRGAIDGIFFGEDETRFRANVFLWGGNTGETSDGITGRLGCMIRVIPKEIPALETLALPPYMRSLADANYGLLLVVGPTGGGKTTTTASYIDYINHHRAGHIVKIEDPIEFVHREDKCRISAREIGTNVESFETGVRDAMRELPTAIAVGEIRNQETLFHTIRAGASGHYVTATRHAPSLVSGIRALVDDLPGDTSANAVMVAETLLGVIFQVCVPGIDGNWHFVHEVMNVTNNERAKEYIAAQKWPSLRDLLTTPASTGDNRLAKSLNEGLASLVVDKKVTRLAAERKAYDRTGLAREIGSLNNVNSANKAKKEQVA